MDSAKLFKNGQSQAVRLPKEYRMEGEEVFIKKVGNTIMLIPKNDPWHTFKQAISEFTEDFMEERNMPTNSQRKELFE